MLAITPIPAFKDNYIWLLRSATVPENNSAIVVDPGDAIAVFNAMKHHNLQLSAMLITHHHYDHINGIEALLERYPDAKVYGPHNSPVTLITNPLKDQDTFELPNNLGICSVLGTPGHTLDHICYHIDNHLFCGDTLFSAGCGRLFEGAPEQMMASLNKLASLPTNTYIYPAHEYTLANLRFALDVETDNTAIHERFNEAQQLRNTNVPTLPSTLQLELATNPFLRCKISGIHTRVEQHTQRKLSSELEVFTSLRLWKDSY